MIKKCTGCGIELQDKNKNTLGYVDNLEKNICERCFKLKNYGEYKGVSLTNETYKQILSEIPSDSLVVYLTSLLNINLESFIKKLKMSLALSMKSPRKKLSIGLNDLKLDKNTKTNLS